jgi:U3 small nucleolar RNA-associated protein 14
MENGGLTSETLNKVLYGPVLDISKVKGHIRQAFDDDLENLNVEALSDKETEELLGYVTSESLKESLERQKVLSTQFFQEVNERRRREVKNERDPSNCKVHHRDSGSDSLRVEGSR